MTQCRCLQHAWQVGDQTTAMTMRSNGARQLPRQFQTGIYARDVLGNSTTRLDPTEPGAVTAVYTCQVWSCGLTPAAAVSTGIFWKSWFCGKAPRVAAAGIVPSRVPA